MLNVAGDEAVTITDLVGRIAQIAGVAPAIVHQGEGPAGDLLGDNARMKDVLGVVPEVTLDDGLRGVVEELRRFRSDG